MAGVIKRPVFSLHIVKVLRKSYVEIKEGLASRPTGAAAGKTEAL